MKFIVLLLFPLLALAQQSDIDESPFGSGFVAIEGGLFRILGNDRNNLDDAGLIYLNFGFNLAHELKAPEEFEALDVGPKIGMGVGRKISTNITALYLDALLKVRYSFGNRGWWARPYLDAGPGMISYTERAFQLEGGGGLDFLFGTGSAGIIMEYKEVFGATLLHRGVGILGSLGYHF